MKYYLVSSSGSALFTLPYPEDFCYHCLHLLIDNPLYSDFYLVPELAYTAGFFLSLFACDGATVYFSAISWGVRGSPAYRLLYFII